jgi:hypothetical protein
MRKRLSKPVIKLAEAAKILGIRAGARTDHRFVGVWPIVVQGRLFARSWTSKRDGWNQTFLDDPLGVIQVADRELHIRAVRVKSEKLRDAIDEAYAAKYDTKASQKYVRGLCSEKRRETTTEFVPR